MTRENTSPRNRPASASCAMRGSGSHGARLRHLPTAARSHCAPPARTRSGAGTSLILASLVAGQCFYLYLIRDVFSRQPRWLGALLRAGEPSRPRSCSARLILARRGGHPGAGPALRQWLAYERRHSACHPATAGGRPLLQPPRGSSNDNPDSEALFKTCKYHPGFPEQPSEESRAGPHLGRRIRPLVQRRAPPQRHPLRHPRSTPPGRASRLSWTAARLSTRPPKPPIPNAGLAGPATGTGSTRYPSTPPSHPPRRSLETLKKRHENATSFLTTTGHDKLWRHGSGQPLRGRAAALPGQR